MELMKIQKQSSKTNEVEFTSFSPFEKRKDLLNYMKSLFDTEIEKFKTDFESLPKTLQWFIISLKEKQENSKISHSVETSLLLHDVLCDLDRCFILNYSADKIIHFVDFLYSKRVK